MRCCRERLVTLNAVGFQEAIAAKLIEPEWDYLLRVKSHQPPQGAAVENGENQARMRPGNALEYFSVPWQITLNVLRQDHSVKAGVKTCHLLASAGEAYRPKLLHYQR